MAEPGCPLLSHKFSPLPLPPRPSLLSSVSPVGFSVPVCLEPPRPHGLCVLGVPTCCVPSTERELPEDRALSSDLTLRPRVQHACWRPGRQLLLSTRFVG